MQDENNYSGEEEMLEGEDPSSERSEREEYIKRMAVLESLGQTIAKMRDEAVKGRAASGIEQEWLEDEEHYEGIDDANRAEMPRKSLSPTGNPRISSGDELKTTRSTIFLNITRPYVDAASARVCDMLLPTDDRNWEIKPTPVPDLIERMSSQKPLLDPNTGVQMLRPARDGEELGDDAPVLPTGAKGVPATEGDLARDIIEVAKQRAEKAQARIDDWLSECQYHAEVRLQIESAARVGTGIIKGPIPAKVRSKATINNGQGMSLAVEEKINPTSKWVSVWNFYPDPNCGDDIRNGKFVVEYDELNGRMLDKLKGVDGYIDEAIESCIEEGPMNYATKQTAKQAGQVVTGNEMYDVWYFTGYVTGKEMRAAGLVVGEEEESDMFPVIITLVNDRVVKVALSPLDSGEFPYDVMVWQRRVGHWAGISVSRQMRTCQRGINAGARNLMDNAGVSSGPQIVVDRSKIIPANGRWEMTPRKIWWTVDGADMNSARDAFIVVTIPSLQVELMNIIQLFMKMAEDVTGMPMLLQGQMGKAPDTVGGMQMLNNNGTSVMRRIARTFDDRVTERHITRYYEWLLIHGTNNDEKGDFKIRARGSSALVEREAQSQIIMGVLGASLNPAYGVNPEKVMAEFLKSQRLDAKRMEYTDEEKQRMAKNQGTPPPQIVAAQIREQGATQRTQMELQAEAEQRQQDRMLDQWMKQIDTRIEEAQLTTEQRMAFDGLKNDLMRDVMKLRTQKELAGQKAQADLMMKPPTEPPGRAQTGMSFQQ